MTLPVVVVLHDDPLVLSTLCQRVHFIHPAANCLAVTRVSNVLSILTDSAIDLLIVGLDVRDDVLDLLLHRSRQTAPIERTLVIGRPGARALVTLCRLRVGGVFDLPEEPIENLDAAIRQVREGRTYWSHTFTKALASHDARLILHQLSPAEQLALATMGDGCSDKMAAERLGMTLHAARSLRQHLYAKLGVHDKEELQRIAARMGFTRFSPEGVVAMGLARLVVEYVEGSKRPVTLPQATLARHGFVHANLRSGSYTPFSKSG